MQYPKLKPGSEAYTTVQTAKILNEKFETFRAWMKNGFVKGGTKVARGDGYQTVFSRLSLYRIKAFVSLQKMFPNYKAAAFTRNLLPEDFEHILYVPATGNKDHEFYSLNEKISIGELADGGLINLKEVREHVDHAIEAFFRG